MKNFDIVFPEGRAPSVAEFLLLITALRIQLSPSKWAEMETRYRAVAQYLESPGSLVADLVGDSYPQGSARIGATVAARGRLDEHDVDFVNEWRSFPTGPEGVIDLLFRSLDRGPGGRYHGMCRKRNRCVTIEYADGHLDVTPALRSGPPWRTSIVPDRNLDDWVTSNPEGFANWFEERLRASRPPTIRFRELPAGDLRERAAEPFPEQQSLHEKPVTLLGLQLIKRWRDLRYLDRRQRKPPSVVLSWFAAMNAAPRAGLFEELVAQCMRMTSVISAEHQQGRLLSIVNPCCGEDAEDKEVLTDRWPSTLDQQGLFLADLEELSRDLAELPTASLARQRQVLGRLFGEDVAEIAVEEFERRYDRARARAGVRYSAGGASIAAPTILGAASALAAPPHRFFGRNPYRR